MPDTSNFNSLKCIISTEVRFFNINKLHLLPDIFQMLAISQFSYGYSHFIPVNTVFLFPSTSFKKHPTAFSFNFQSSRITTAFYFVKEWGSLASRSEYSSNDTMIGLTELATSIVIIFNRPKGLLIEVGKIWYS
jgi:hypothetical protein